MTPGRVALLVTLAGSIWCELRIIKNPFVSERMETPTKRIREETQLATITFYYESNLPRSLSFNKSRESF